jgi:hypothetical protein
MKQPARQVPLAQTSPVPQVVPLTFVHPAVLTLGWQLWQAFEGLVAAAP